MLTEFYLQISNISESEIWVIRSATNKLLPIS